MQEFLISWKFWPFLGLQSWKMAFFGDFCVFTLLRGPGKTEKNQNFKNSRIRIVKHPILMMYTEIHENSMKTERLDRFLPKFTLKFMFFLLYKDLICLGHKIAKKLYFLAKNDDFYEKSAIFSKQEKSILSLNFYWIWPRISINTLQVGVKKS